MNSAILAAARRQATNAPGAIDAVERFLTASFAAKHPEMHVQVSAASTPDGRVIATATGSVPMALMQVLGVKRLPISATSAAQFGAGVAEVALVLDNTFSMNGPKIDALKEGAKELVDIIFAPHDATQTVRVGVVPFGRYVNVGVGYRNESWMSVAPDSVTPTNYCRNEYPNAVSYNCRAVIPMPPITMACRTRSTPRSARPTTVIPCGPARRRSDTQTWNGCAGSRPHPLDTTTSGDFSTPVPGIMNVSCPQPLSRLSNVPSSIKSEIDGMTAIGETYIPAGLAWGWRVLSKDGPFGDGDNRSDRPDLKKFIVLMTDGANTISPTYPDHGGSDAAAANALTGGNLRQHQGRGHLHLCHRLRCARPLIQDLLEDCATAPPYYFRAEDSDDLREAFSEIANSISAVRLTQ